jgi:hypothetical protein
MRSCGVLGRRITFQPGGVKTMRYQGTWAIGTTLTTLNIVYGF